MKDSEFLELLNLYLDHEITAADAARLEAEVQGNPKRREVYNQYCRMQKACKMLAQDFAEAAPVANTSSENVVAFQQPRRSAWGPGFYAAGGLVAAAACLAVVLVKRNTAGDVVPASGTSSKEAYSIVIPPAEKSVVATPSIPRTVTTVPVLSQSDLQPVVSTRMLVLTNSPASASFLPVAQVGVTQLDWIGKLEIAPMNSAPVDAFNRPTPAADPKKAVVQTTDDGITRYLVGFGYGK